MSAEQQEEAASEAARKAARLAKQQAEPDRRVKAAAQDVSEYYMARVEIEEQEAERLAKEHASKKKTGREISGEWYARKPAAGWKTAGVYDTGASIQSQLPKGPKFEFRDKEGIALPLEKNSDSSYISGRVYGEDPYNHGSMVDTGAQWEYVFSDSTLNVSWSKYTCENGPTHSVWRSECLAQCKLAAALCKPPRPIPEPIRM